MYKSTIIKFFIAKRIFEILKLRQVPILSVTVTDNTLLRLEY
jgi:hypothetical protein